MRGGRPIPRDEYATIAEHVPIVSVDLLVRNDGGIVLGKRTNEPAKGEWFVPGGSVLKGETREEAVHRVAREELGCDVVIDQCFGVYDHFYDAAASEGVESKQYLATAYVVTPTDDVFRSDDQHAELQTFHEPFDGVHKYVKRYLDDLGEMRDESE